MRMWLVPALVVVAVLWAWWAKSRMQQRHLAALVRASRGSARRAHAIALTTESIAALVAVVMIVAAFVAQSAHGWWWLRITLSALVIVLYVPYTMTLAEVRLKLKVRRTPQQRMLEMGAPSVVAEEVAKVGRPFAYFGSLMLLAAVIAFLWHLFGS